MMKVPMISDLQPIKTFIETVIDALYGVEENTIDKDDFHLLIKKGAHDLQTELSRINSNTAEEHECECGNKLSHIQKVCNECGKEIL